MLVEPILRTRDHVADPSAGRIRVAPRRVRRVPGLAGSRHHRLINRRFGCTERQPNGLPAVRASCCGGSTCGDKTTSREMTSRPQAGVPGRKSRPRAPPRPRHVPHQRVA